MRLNYPPPQISEEFERLCLELLRTHWKCPSLQLYARRGEKQFGVDIFDEGGGSPLLAAQCKLHDSWISLSPSEIEGEVGKARTFPEVVGVYGILTTAKRSGDAQRLVRKIKKEHKLAGSFSGEYFPWDKINELLNQSPEVAE